MRPAETEYAPYYGGYISRVTEDDVLSVLEAQPSELIAASNDVGDRELLRYAPGKWSVRETFGHLIDTERVMGYRAFCIARGEQKPLPGFDQNDYVTLSHYNDRRVADLAAEFAAVRVAHVWNIRHWTAEEWSRSGNANGLAVTARAIAFIMAGHVRHHLHVLSEKYRIPE
jgi:hypothetical protein